ncbi:hypothetical protein [Streptomyces hydrogenans]|jgi:hypothetical protein|uniref:hypothetical protein n=1 Tax=Streptomyces hydrogenans TaxID=1873719 RepID=UPI00363E1689
MRKSRAAVVGSTIVALVLTTASPSYANWSSFLDQVMNGFESRRWDDGDYSEVIFIGCDQGDATAVDVELWEDISLGYDSNKGSNHLTGCFKSSTSLSHGEWYGLPGNDYYFRIKTVWGSNEMSARSVGVDTTAAD